MIVLTDRSPVLVDREALCLLTGRSPHTIRLRLRPAMQHQNYGALYDLDAATQRLSQIPTRKRMSDRVGQNADQD